MNRRFCCLLLTLCSSVLAPGAEPVVAAKPAEMPFLEQHCLKCHNDQKQKGDFRLDALSRDFTDLQASQKWAEVMFRINAGEMPPEEEKQPSSSEIGGIVDWIAGNLKGGESARMASRGPVAHYRLSRDEYADTVYDLLGVRYDVRAPGAFNEDPRWHGFERVGSMLSLSPSHIDRYFKAAETVLARAFPSQPSKEGKFFADAILMRHHQERKKLEERGIAGQIRAHVWPGGSVSGLRTWWFGALKESGLYRARIKLSGLPGFDGRAPHLSVWDNKLKQSIFDEDILAPEDQPVIVEFETFLSLPMELEFRNEVPGAFSTVGNHTLNVTGAGGTYFTGTKDRGTINPTGYKLFDDDGHALYPMLIVDSVEWEGPIVTAEDLKKREGLIPLTDGDFSEAAACLRRFADRAWRRPATDAEVARYLKIVESELASGEKFRSAFLAAMTGIMASNHFCHLVEGSASERRDRVNDWELASRLSYFLWGSMPDDALFSAAAEGTLHEPDRLRAQLSRMLGDPKAGRFCRAFPQQWLQLHRIGMFPPDPKLYPGYDLWLEKSMGLEATAFFSEVFAKNLPLGEFLDSDWAMVNPRLAQHYGLPPLRESGFQRVSLRPEDHRGGLLTQAGVLMLTSDGTRHRPVHRGVLISEAIFGKTPPPPPPNVMPLEPTPSDQPKATVRMQLEAHSTHAICAACHRKIDPLGFAFDHYDAIGQWRTEEVIKSGQGANPPVNAAGELPDGRTFSGPAEFKSLLVQDIDRFAEAFVEQLATFSLRRVMTFDDSAHIKAIAAAAKQEDYRLRSLIEHLVMSDLFLKR